MQKFTVFIPFYLQCHSERSKFCGSKIYGVKNPLNRASRLLSATIQGILRFAIIRFANDCSAQNDTLTIFFSSLANSSTPFKDSNDSSIRATNLILEAAFFSFSKFPPLSESSTPPFFKRGKDHFTKSSSGATARVTIMSYIFLCEGFD